MEMLQHMGCGNELHITSSTWLQYPAKFAGNGFHLEENAALNVSCLGCRWEKHDYLFKNFNVQKKPNFEISVTKDNSKNIIKRQIESRRK